MVRRGWYHCPACNVKLQPIGPESVMYEVPVYCRRCKVEWFPAIWRGRELADNEPFPLLDQAAQN